MRGHFLEYDTLNACFARSVFDYDNDVSYLEPPRSKISIIIYLLLISTSIEN